jgi:hypothetical protein
MLSFALLGQCQPFNSEIVAFCAAAGEDYLLIIGADKFSDPRASSIDFLPGDIAPIVE